MTVSETVGHRISGDVIYIMQDGHRVLSFSVNDKFVNKLDDFVDTVKALNDKIKNDEAKDAIIKLYLKWNSSFSEREDGPDYEDIKEMVSKLF